MSESKKRWMSSGYLQAAPTGAINHEQGIIEGVSIVTVGEAEGHGVSLDSEFVQRATALGGGRKQGVKARFGHPNMCSTALGTFIGRWKNFRQGTTERNGEEVEACIADLFLSNEAKQTPHGDLFAYVLGMAQNEADMFGVSIVFDPGRIYRRDGSAKVFAPGERVDVGERGADWDEWRELEGPDFVELDELHAGDAVDDPAANEGLFSKFSNETVAGQLTEFLDLNPQVWEAVKANPSIVEALARHGDKMDEFIERYSKYRKQDGDTHMKTDETKTDSEKLEEGDVASAASETSENKEATTEAAETEEATAEEAGNESTAATAEPEAEEATQASAESEAEETAENEEDAPALSRDEFGRIADEFGNEVAATVMRDGGDYNSALKVAFDGMKAERDELAEKSGKSGLFGKPVKVIAVEEKDKGDLFKTGK